jgi:hypothetical protein
MEDGCGSVVWDTHRFLVGGTPQKTFKSFMRAIPSPRRKISSYAKKTPENQENEPPLIRGI